MNKCFSLASLALLLTANTASWAEDPGSNTAMASAATRLLETLDPDQRKATQFPIDSADRATWSNLPILMVPTPGMLLKDMNDDQRKATQSLLRASMSSQGYAKFIGIMRLEDVLNRLGQQQLDATPEEERSRLNVAIVETRNVGNYAVAVFGDPGTAQWGWKLAGHHAAANFTVSGGRISFTPTFLGSSPRVIAAGAYAGTMVMPKEGERGIALMRSLNESQRQEALIADLPNGIFSGPGRQHSLQGYEGLATGKLTAHQKRLLRALVEEYVRNAEFDAADAQLKAIEVAGWDSLWFSWRGPVEAEGRFYYRVHGPRLLIEYSRVDENHDHSIVRDPHNDYGVDWLGEHLEEHHPTMEQIRKDVQQRLGVRIPD